MNDEHYNRYQQVLSYLYEIGREFSEKHPRHAQYVAEQGGDPDARIVTQAFAFNVARILNELDDRLPFLTYTLLEIFCPQYLRPIPCATTVQFTSTDPRRGTQHLPIGTRLNSVPVFGTSCTFHSSYETSVHPITLESVRQIGRSLRLNFQLEEGARFDELDLKRLRLHLHGHPRYTLYLGLSRYVKKLTAFGDADREPIAFTQDNIEPVGFEEKLLPDPTPSFAGLGLLSEYFVFPDKFMYVEIVGLEALRGKVAKQFELQIEFDRDFALPIFIDPDQIRLNCTPAVNRFPMDSRPIEVDGTRLEYPIVVDVNLSEPSMDQREHYKLYSVDRVLAWAQETLGPRKYEPFYSFKHGFVRRKDTVYYQTHLRGRSPTLSFVPSGDGVPAVDEVSLKLTCSNGRLPEHLRLGSISGEMPDVEYQNISGITNQMGVPSEDLHWRLIAHLTKNRQFFVDREILRDIFSLYNFQQSEGGYPYLNAIKTAQSETLTRLYRGAPVHGTAITIRLGREGFADKGDLFLLGAVLNHHFASHTPINTFTQLTVIEDDTGEKYTWPVIAFRR